MYGQLTVLSPMYLIYELLSNVVDEQNVSYFHQAAFFISPSTNSTPWMTFSSHL
jgi:hypothetical protein